ncbi:hypothetical protein IRJ41_022865, partial [Triplophysa rosa]
GVSPETRPQSSPPESVLRSDKIPKSDQRVDMSLGCFGTVHLMNSPHTAGALKPVRRVRGIQAHRWGSYLKERDTLGSLQFHFAFLLHPGC